MNTIEHFRYYGGAGAGAGAGRGKRSFGLIYIMIIIIFIFIILIISIVSIFIEYPRGIKHNELCLKYQNQPDIHKFKTVNKFSYKYKKNNKKRTLTCNYNHMTQYQNGLIRKKYIFALIVIIFFLIGFIISIVFVVLEYKKAKKKEEEDEDKKKKSTKKNEISTNVKNMKIVTILLWSFFISILMFYLVIYHPVSMMYFISIFNPYYYYLYGIPKYETDCSKCLKPNTKKQRKCTKKFIYNCENNIFTFYQKIWIFIIFLFLIGSIISTYFLIKFKKES